MTDNAGCIDTLSIYVPQIIGMVDNINSELDVSVFPNPSQGEFLLTAKVREDDNCTIILRDIKGKMLHQKKAKPMNGLFKQKFNLSGFAKGIYNMQVIIGEETYNKRILIE